MGVGTAYEFTQLARDLVRKNMTITGERTWSELCGQPCIEMETEAPPKQTIMVSRSFGKMIGDENIVREAVSTYTAMAAAKLRKQKSCAASMMVFINTNRFRDDLPQYSRHVVMKFPVAENSTQELIHYAFDGLEKIYRPGYLYKKAGVMLMDICPQDSVQGYLFDNVDRKKHQGITTALDGINERYGRNTLKYACMGDGSVWRIRQERLSPCYTTRVADFPKVV